jgi:hypothetical protein
MTEIRTGSQCSLTPTQCEKRGSRTTYQLASWALHASWHTKCGSPPSNGWENKPALDPTPQPNYMHWKTIHPAPHSRLTALYSRGLGFKFRLSNWLSLGFRGFRRILLINIGIVFQISPGPLPSAFLQIHYSQIISLSSFRSVPE